MSDSNLNSTFGPRFVLTLSQCEPLRLHVGTGFNNINDVTSKTLDVTITALETLNAYRAVGYDGMYTQPDVDSLSIYAGVTRMATPIGDPVDVVRSGLMTENGWNWTVNQPLFISTNGVITQTVPVGVIRRIGWAVASNQINLDPYPIIGV